jgi:hypothetical protein
MKESGTISPLGILAVVASFFLVMFLVRALKGYAEDTKEILKKVNTKGTVKPHARKPEY